MSQGFLAPASQCKHLLFFVLCICFVYLSFWTVGICDGRFYYLKEKKYIEKIIIRYSPKSFKQIIYADTLFLTKRLNQCSYLEWSADVPPKSAEPQLWFPSLICPKTAHKLLPANRALSWLSPEDDTLTEWSHLISQNPSQRIWCGLCYILKMQQSQC